VFSKVVSCLVRLMKLMCVIGFEAVTVKPCNKFFKKNLLCLTARRKLQGDVLFEYV